MKQLNRVLGGQNTNATGTIGELFVTIDLIEKGYEIYRGINSNQSVDLIALKNRQCYRIEVKHGYRSKSSIWGIRASYTHAYTYGKRKGKMPKGCKKFDILAVYVRKGRNRELLPKHYKKKGILYFIKGELCDL